MHGDMHAMAMQLLPTWLRAAWAVALCAVAALHVVHIWAASGQRRWWHAGHTAMAAGMALMYAIPRMHHPEPYRVGLVLFAALTVALLGTALHLRGREGRLNPLWLFTAVDMLAMAVMLLPTSSRPAAVNIAFAAYLGAHALAWAFGLWDRLPALSSPVRTAAPSRTPAPAAGDPDNAAEPLPAPPRPAPAATGAVFGLTAHSSRLVHLSLAVMAASMAYMFVAMQ